eukprot:TRINITY_DN7087_c0_g1_i6.p1 TRINITY_DN7087_c0_g1~~TRINITY_DN7087_c0_g1_i6.p1  ORF type:complete len:289 (+),score=29.20 TRINITY_DN7087_c0_g1_i6:716-1582(+)
MSPQVTSSKINHLSAAEPVRDPPVSSSNNLSTTSARYEAEAQRLQKKQDTLLGSSKTQTTNPPNMHMGELYRNHLGNTREHVMRYYATPPEEFYRKSISRSNNSTVSASQVINLDKITESTQGLKSTLATPLYNSGAPLSKSYTEPQTSNKATNGPHAVSENNLRGSMQSVVNESSLQADRRNDTIQSTTSRGQTGNGRSHSSSVKFLSRYDAVAVPNSIENPVSANSETHHPVVNPLPFNIQNPYVLKEFNNVNRGYFARLAGNNLVSQSIRLFPSIYIYDQLVPLY